VHIIRNVNLLISPTYSLGGAGVIDALPTAHNRSLLSRRNVNKQKIKVEFVELVKL